MALYRSKWWDRLSLVVVELEVEHRGKGRRIGRGGGGRALLPWSALWFNIRAVRRSGGFFTLHLLRKGLER